MNLIIHNLKKIFYKILCFLLREKITTNKSNVYIKDGLAGRITIEYSRLFKSYAINSKIEEKLYCKIQDMFCNYIKVYKSDTHFVFVEKRGWRYSACIELFCEKYDKDLLCNRIAKSKLID